MSDDPRDRAKEDLEAAQEAIADAREQLEQTVGDTAKPADGIDLSGGGGPPGGGPTED